MEISGPPSIEDSEIAVPVNTRHSDSVIRFDAFGLGK
jgi:hypothetical protein